MVETVVNADLFTSKNLKEYFDAAFSEAWLSRDGLEWYESISKHVEVFLQSPPDERSSSFV